MEGLLFINYSELFTSEAAFGLDGGGRHCIVFDMFVPDCLYTWLTSPAIWLTAPAMCSRIIGILNKLKRLLLLNIKSMLYNTLILSHLNYGLKARGYRCDRIKKLQKKAVRIICLSKYNAHTDPLFKRLNLLKVEHILKLQELKLCHTFSNNKLPVYMQNLSLDENNSVHNFNTRGQYNIHTIRVHDEFAKRSLSYSLPHTINNAPDLLKDQITTHSLHGFSNYIKLYYLNTYIEQCAIQNCYICQHD